MGCEQMMEKMTFLLYGNDLCRVDIYEKEDGGKSVVVDLHGFKRKNVERLLNNIIAVYRFSFELILIHGYSHGTTLKELIWNQYENDRIQRKASPLYNPGITYLFIK